MAYAVIVDNGGSDLRYNDIAGKVYTFPKKYLHILQPGTKFIYQRCSVSKMKVKEPDTYRLLKSAHYFGFAEIGKIKSVGGDLFEAEIINFHHFNKGVPFRQPDGSHYETCPKNFYRNGVRSTSEEVYNSIIAASV